MSVQLLNFNNFTDANHHVNHGGGMGTRESSPEIAVRTLQGHCSDIIVRPYFATQCFIHHALRSGNNVRINKFIKKNRSTHLNKKAVLSER